MPWIVYGRWKRPRLGVQRILSAQFRENTIKEEVIGKYSSVIKIGTKYYRPPHLKIEINLHAMASTGNDERWQRQVLDGDANNPPNMVFSNLQPHAPL